MKQNETLHTQEEIHEIVSILSGRTVCSLLSIGSGGNNRVYRVTLDDGAVIALKFYPAQKEDTRDRLGVEWDAISLLYKNGIDQIPEPIMMSRERNCAVYKWIEGTSPDPSIEAVDQMSAFLISLQELITRDDARAIRPASGACFSAAAVADQLIERRQRLDEPAEGQVALDIFLKKRLDPQIDVHVANARTDYQLAGLNFDEELEVGGRCLSPSDFGLHNAIIGRDGRLAFVDFEYFGWDSPVKSVSDFVLHPGSAFTDPLLRHSLEIMVPYCMSEDQYFLVRLKALYPLFALIWCLILLNEFLPESWTRRVIAGEASDCERIQARQLGRAEKRLESIRNIYDIAPGLA